MQRKKSLQHLSAYVPGKPIEDVLKEYGLTSAIKLASNENPYGYSPKVKQTLQDNLEHLQIYPDGGAKVLKEALAKYHQLTSEQFLIGAGLDEIIQIISRSLLSEGDNVIVADPTFPQYGLHATIEGANVKKISVDPKTGLTNLNEMLAAIDSDTKIIWLCNPNNPTGTYLKQRDIKRFLEKVPNHVLVISDEAYYDYVTEEKMPTSLPFINEFENLVILRTFSKAYGLAGLRVGYAIVPNELNAIFNITRLPFNSHSLAQKAAITALADQAFVTKSQELNQIEREKWGAFLTQLGLHYYHSEANFIFFEVKQETLSLSEELLKKGFIIRAGLKPGWLRITIGTAADNLAIQKELKKIIKK